MGLNPVADVLKRADKVLKSAETALGNVDTTLGTVGTTLARMTSTMAASAPTVMDRTAISVKIGCQSACRCSNGPVIRRTISAIAATFGTSAKYAVTGVGAPS